MISIIAAICKNNAIGKNNDLIYHIPEDLERFKKLTINKNIIMGRKTFESLPSVLPQRRHIIITTNKAYTVPSKDVIIQNDISEIIRKSMISDEEYFVIGGESIYKAFLPYASRLYLTRIDKEASDADAFFPEVNLSNYKNIYTSKLKHCNLRDVDFYFNDFEK